MKTFISVCIDDNCIKLAKHRTQCILLGIQLYDKQPVDDKVHAEFPESSTITDNKNNTNNINNNNNSTYY